jgi:chromate transporter
VLTFIGSRLWYRFRDATWRRLVQRGLVPVTAGLVMASAALLIRATLAEWGTTAITVAATLLCSCSRGCIHCWALGATATLGASGLLT